MLEIIVLWYLSKKNSRIAKEKGYSGIGFVLLTIFLWFFFEIFGLILGGIILGDSLVMYGIGILSAGVGGVISHIIVKSLKNKNGSIENLINDKNESYTEYSDFDNENRQ